MLKTCHCVHSLFLYFPPAQLSGHCWEQDALLEGSLMRPTVASPLSLLHVLWYSRGTILTVVKAISVLSKIIHAARVCSLHPASNNYLICSGWLCPWTT